MRLLCVRAVYASCVNVCTCVCVPVFVPCVLPVFLLCRSRVPPVSCSWMWGVGGGKGWKGGSGGENPSLCAPFLVLVRVYCLCHLRVSACLCVTCAAFVMYLPCAPSACWKIFTSAPTQKVCLPCVPPVCASRVCPPCVPPLYLCPCFYF